MSFANRLSSNLNCFARYFKLWECPRPYLRMDHTSLSYLNSPQWRIKLWEGSRPFHTYVTSRPCLNRPYKQNMAPKTLLRRGISSKVVLCYFEENEIMYPQSEELQMDKDIMEDNIQVKENVSVLLVSIPVDEKLSFCAGEPLIKIHRASYFTNRINSIFTNYSGNPYLHFLGCLDKSGQDFDVSGQDLDDACAVPDENRKDVYCYDLRTELNEDNIIRCESMKFGTFVGLSVQIEHCIYLLSYPSASEKIRAYGFPFVLGIDTTVDYDNGILRPLIQKYDMKKKTWDHVGDTGSNDIINLCISDRYVLTIDRTPHVVIGPKLHVSIGNSSFTFDSRTHVWEKSKLFEAFWSEQKNKKSGLSPSNFYGYRVGVGRDENEAKLGKGGPPLGFYGKGIIWDNNILLGIHNCADCPLVAFLLVYDENGEQIVLKSQPISLDNLTLPHGVYSYSKLVDLGNGFFCLTYVVRDRSDVCDDDDPFSYRRFMELVTFKVSKPKSADSDDFIECKLISKKRITRQLPESIDSYFEAFHISV